MLYAYIYIFVFLDDIHHTNCKPFLSFAKHINGHISVKFLRGHRLISIILCLQTSNAIMKGQKGCLSGLELLDFP